MEPSSQPTAAENHQFPGDSRLPPPFDMFDRMGRVLDYAKEALAHLGLEVRGLRYTTAPDQLASGDRLLIVFDAFTSNPNIFGECYENAKRILLLGELYNRLGGKVAEEAEDKPFWLDAFVSLKRPYSVSESPLQRPGGDSFGLVDVHANNSVRFLTIEEAVSEGTLRPGSPLEQYCTRYGGKHVLKHGGHFISPDPITLEMLEAFMEARNIKSFLEIGSGVGLSAAAGEREGLIDFGLVDLNPTVAAFLNKRHPGKATVQNALEYKFDRHWDLVQIGLPYELIPWFLQKNGADLANHTDAVVLQSGCLTFFGFEHAWIMGDPRIQDFPWYNGKQSISAHFPYHLEARYGYQSCIVASKRPLDDLKREMERREFTRPSYATVISSPEGEVGWVPTSSEWRHLELLTGPNERGHRWWDDMPLGRGDYPNFGQEI